MKKLILFIGLLLIPYLAFAQTGEISTDGRATGGVIVQDEGVNVSAAPFLNFVGAGVAATSDSVKTFITISGVGTGDIERVGDCSSGECLVTGGNVTIDTAVITTIDTSLTGNRCVETDGTGIFVADGSACNSASAPTYDAIGDPVALQGINFGAFTNTWTSAVAGDFFTLKQTVGQVALRVDSGTVIFDESLAVGSQTGTRTANSNTQFGAFHNAWTSTATGTFFTLDGNDGHLALDVVDGDVNIEDALTVVGDLTMPANVVDDSNLNTTDHYVIRPHAMKIGGSFITAGARPDAGDPLNRLLFATDSTEEALEHFTAPTGCCGSPVAKITYSMAEACSTEKVDWEIKIGAVADGEAMNTDPFDTLNEITGATSCPGTADLRDTVSLTLTNFDSGTAGETIVVHIQRDHDDGDDNASGDAQLHELNIEWTR